MDRLLAICRFRFNGGVSRLDWIGALLWLDGAAISTSFIRDALRREAERPNLKPLPRGDKLDRIAIKVGRLGIVRESAPTLAPVDREGLALRVMEAVQGATTLSDELMANLCAAFDVTPEEIESFLQGLSAPGVGSVASVVEAADDYYELARQRWLTDWHQPKESRSRKGRVRFRRTLYGFLQCLLSLQLSPGTLGPGEPK
jgi:hypothetical protein